MQLDPTEVDYEQLFETMASSFKGEGFFYSTSLIRLIQQLLSMETDSEELYAPFVCDPGLLHALATNYSVLAESSFSTRFIGLYKIIFDLDFELKNSDPLQAPGYLDAQGLSLRKFVNTVSIPPFGYRLHKPVDSDIFMRFDEDTLKSRHFEPRVISHIAAQTKEKAIVGFPESFANQQSLSKFRANYVANGWVSKVIRLPGNLLNNTALPCLLFVFDFANKSDEILMVDASEIYTKHKRNNILTQEEITAILALCEAPSEKHEFWCKASIDDLSANNYNLDPRRYVVSASECEYMAKFKDYEACRLGDLVEIIRPQQVNGQENEGETWSEVLCNDIPDFGYMDSVERTKHLTNKELDKAKRYKIFNKDILLSVRGTIGKVAIVSEAEDKQWYPSQSLVILRPNQQRIVPEYLYLYMKSTLFNTVIDKRAIGSVIRNLSAREIDELQIPMMSLAAQQELKEQKFQEGEKLIKVIKEATAKLNSIADFF
jgi:type I restriction enzyme M protein